MHDHACHLELVLRDPHGRPVTGAQVQLAGGGALVAGHEHQPGRYQLALRLPGDYQLRVRRFDHPDGIDHRTLRQTLFLTWQQDRPLLHVLEPPAEQRSRVRAVHPVAADHSHQVIEVTLDYLWFTHIGTPPVAGNQVELLVDGELGWGAVAEAIESARDSVHLATWMYSPTCELRRPDPLLPKRMRLQHTVHDMLCARAADGVTVRLLLWDAPVLPMPSQARQAARQADDHFEVMQEANLTERPILDEERFPGISKALGSWQIGSFHQKTVVVDGRLGFCGGMNLRDNDWDRRAHDAFEPRRSAFGRNRTFRERVMQTLRRPDHRPRHDYIARLRGPAVPHLEANFRERWNRLIDTEAQHWQRSTPVDEPAACPPAGPSAVQVVRTMPAPYGPGGSSERGILDVHLRAIRAARKLIYIEDQYFRSTHVSDAIAEAIRSWPDLHVIVVTVEGYANDALAGGWTQECFERIQARRPGFQLHTLRVLGRPRRGRPTLDEIDNHAKLMIVDDRFLTVGSANINDRGFEFEGEINLAVVDPELVGALRLDIWREHLADDPRLSGDLHRDVAIWKEHAERNAAFDPQRDERPASHVFPFVPSTERSTWLGYDVM